MTLQRVIVTLMWFVLFVVLLPGGLALDRRLTSELERRTRHDLARQPSVFSERKITAADGMMMHAKELGATPGLAQALARGNRAEAVRLLEQARGGLGDSGLLTTSERDAWLGPHPGAELVGATRAHRMPVEMITRGDTVWTVALSPVEYQGNWVGAAGYATRFDQAEAGRLAGLTRADVMVRTQAGRLAASSRDEVEANPVLAWLTPRPVADSTVVEIHPGGQRLLVASAPAGAGAAVYFLRSLDTELSVLQPLRRTALGVALLALASALVLAVVLAGLVARPVRALAAAADRLAVGDLDAPLRPTAITEFRRLATAFKDMRDALGRRVNELESANRELVHRGERLIELQAELIRRDRLAAAGQLVTQLAHEIRNPVANVRNCLELLRRRVAPDAQARELTELATDELLRMHELAERVLDLHRPAADNRQDCDAGAVARTVASLFELGDRNGVHVEVHGDAMAALPADALKQVLSTLVQNASEAMANEGTVIIELTTVEQQVVIEVTDTGPGIRPDALRRIFDPFFTTKAGVQGIGLGLFVADRIIRSHGGRIRAQNRVEGGARFIVEAPAATVQTGVPANTNGLPTGS